MPRNSKKICVIGIWHLGAVYSACLADLGYRVIGVDNDAARVNELNKGIPHCSSPACRNSLPAISKPKD